MIENNVPILRESDILKPEFVRTPCERMYLALQLAYIDESRQAQHLEAYRELAADVAKAAPSCRPLIRQVTKALADGENYRALKCAARLREHERELLTHVQ
jgi:flagellar protein FlbT